MFHGGLPTDAINIIGKEIKKWNEDEKCKRLYVGCSGNFTIERSLNDIWGKEIISNDVTIYSCVLGWYFSGNKIKLKMKKEYDGFFKFAEEYMTTEEGKLVCVMILADALKFEIEPEKMVDYNYRMLNAYKEQWDNMFEKTLNKVKNMKTKVDRFYAGDVCKLIDEVDDNDAFICYPPFYSGDYEKMFKCLENVFDWEEPVYDMIDKEKIYELFRKMTTKRHFMFCVDEDLEEFAEYKFAETQTTNRGRKIYMYSNCDDLVYLQPNQNIANVNIERLSETDDIKPTDEIRLIKLESKEFHALRSQYMNASIKPGQETLAIGVMINNKLIGVYAFSTSNTLTGGGMAKHMDMPMIYLLSDFPVNTTKYKRLAKLVLIAALSKESQMIAQKLSRKRIKSIGTNAFSKNPVSMKYRGLFDLKVKQKMSDTVNKENADISEIYYNTGYKLYYGASMGKWTLKEGLEEWCRKHSVVKKEGEKSEN